VGPASADIADYHLQLKLLAQKTPNNFNIEYL